MKKLFLYIGLALFIGAFTGCKKENPTETNGNGNGNGVEYTIENYFPLAVGNKWIHREISYDPWDSVTPYDTIIDTMVVEKTYKWEGKDVFEVTVQSNSQYYVYYDGELRAYEDPPGQDTLYFLYLKEPLEEGKSWWLFPWADTSNICEIVSTNFSLITPAGDFTNCIKIDIELSEETYFVFAPGVGWAKWYQRWFNGMWCETVILEYDIK